MKSDKDSYVLYSVPYDEGWYATMNGEPVQIQKTNIGFMSVLCKKGNNDIVFTYQTPGLQVGMYMSLGGILLLGLWMIIEKKFFRAN